MATVSPLEVARLPAALRPRKIVDASDVTLYALDLVRGDVMDNEGTQRVVHRLAYVFSRAALRLSEILSGERPPERAPAFAEGERQA
jgi:hypothetical protein